MADTSEDTRAGPPAPAAFRNQWPSNSGEPENDVVEFNILLLGDTGVGKSTFINGFALYLNYDSLQSAERATIDFPIPFKLTITDPDTFDERSVTTGDDPNEDLDSVGHSVTQYPRTYEVRQGNTLLRLIDTPGVNDTRGRNTDIKNIENSLNYLSSYRSINAICILVKAGSNRLTESFKYSFQKLFSSLHESAQRNIIFCFTNAYPGFRPKDEVKIVKQFLAENNLGEINISANTVYFVDNKAVSYVIEMQQGADPSEADQLSVNQCWKETVSRVKKLVEYVKSLAPHSVRDSLALCYANRTIKVVSKPLIDIASMITVNVKEIEERRKQLETIRADMPLEVFGIINTIALVMFRFSYTSEDGTSMVCTAEKCMSVVDGKVVCSQICHAKCGCRRRRLCRAFNLLSGKCKDCNCSYFDHERKKLNEKFTIEDETGDIKEQVSKSKSEAEVIIILNKYIVKMKDVAQQMCDEQRHMTTVCAKLAVFMRSNTLFQEESAQDYLSKYLHKKIDRYDKLLGALARLGVKQVLKNTGVNTAELCDALSKMKTEYDTQVEEMMNNSQNFELHEIDALIANLYVMPRYGAMIKRAVDEITAANEADNKQCAKSIACSSTGALSSMLSLIGISG